MGLSQDLSNQGHLEEEPGYIIDTSALIKLEPYYIDVFPSLWECIEKLITDGRLVAPQEVQIEIHDKYDDGWNTWIKRHNVMFIDKKETQTKVKRIQNWYPGLTKKDNTQTDADYYVIALAEYMGNWTVVSDEGRRKSQLRIPDVCAKLKVPCVDLHNFFKKCNWRY